MCLSIGGNFRSSVDILTYHVILSVPPASVRVPGSRVGAAAAQPGREAGAASLTAASVPACLDGPLQGTGTLHMACTLKTWLLKFSDSYEHLISVISFCSDYEICWTHRTLPVIIENHCFTC